MSTTRTTTPFLRASLLPGTIVGAALGLWALHRLNAFLSRRALNNWNLSHPWNFSSSSSSDGKDAELVLVTGGCSGIGLSVVRQLASRGVRVAVLDVNEPSPGILPSGVGFFRADVTSSADVRAAAAQLREQMGGDPTVVVNNAGLATGRSLLAQDEAEFRRTFEVNTVAQWVVLREFLPAMVRRDHGHVVTVASTASFVTIAGMVDYSASKMALVALDEGMRQELRWRYGAPNVRTSIIHPNWARTPLTEGLLHIPQKPWMAHLLEVDEVADAIVKQILGGESGRVVLPKRLERTVLWLRFMPMWYQELLRNRMASLMDVEAYTTPGSYRMGAAVPVPVPAEG